MSKQKIPERYPFTQWCTFGMHLYKTDDEDATVEFVDEKTGRRKTIVDKSGNIIGFPGIEKGEWIHHLENKNRLMPQIRFRTDFKRCGDGKYMMIWEVQPDGRYWEDDDGFGGTSDDEIRLYTFLDENGNFTEPFKIYNVGGKDYYRES